MVRFQQIAAIALVFVIAGIALGIGSQVLSDIKADVTDATAQHAIENASLGLLELAGWMPTIGLVIAAAIIIGVIFSAFAPGRGGL